ncbi:MAG: endonuclease domain-containing protein [Patescibacteria group bacterium]
MTRLINRSTEKAKRRTLRNAMPKAEYILWQQLRRKQIAGVTFRRQVSVGKYVVDFYCSARRLAIEVDGETHIGKEAEAYDAERQKYLEDLGIRVIRFWNTDVYKNLAGVIDEVLHVVRKI